MATPQPPKQIIGERIFLKARSIVQSEEVFALTDANREHLRPWMPWEATTLRVEDTLRYLSQAEKWWEKGEMFDYSLYEKPSNKLIGSFGLHNIDWGKRTCHLGFWIDQEKQGKGYIAEAMKLGESAALNLGFHRIVMTCDRLNTRSAAVAHRNGYKLEATLLDECKHLGRMRDTLQFVKLLNLDVPGEITENLPEGYSIRHVSTEEFRSKIGDLQRKVFDEKELILRPQDVLSEREKDQLRLLGNGFKTEFRYNSLVLFKGEVVGWSWGYQDSADSVYMTNSAVLPEHRGRSLYSRILDITMDHLKEKGFQRIWSRHNTTNNNVIIPKLKRGFVITGTELSDVFGSLLHLTYFTNPLRRKVLDFRAGSLRPDDEIKAAFKI